MNSGSCIVKCRHHENGLLKYFLINYKHVCSGTSMSAVKGALSARDKDESRAVCNENNTAEIYHFLANLH